MGRPGPRKSPALQVLYCSRRLCDLMQLLDAARPCHNTAVVMFCALCVARRSHLWYKDAWSGSHTSVKSMMLGSKSEASLSTLSVIAWGG